MSFICIQKEKVDAFKQALKDKTLNLTDLLDSKMTSEARTKIFSEYTANEADAKTLNTLFEEKLVLKNRMLGIANLFSKEGGFGKYSADALAEKAKALSDYKAAQQERIFSPKEHEAFLNDLADKKLGVHVSKEVAQKVFDLQQKADAVKNVDVKMSGTSDEYLKAKSELDSYVNSQKPISVSKSLGNNLAIIARNDLLMNPATPIKTTIGQFMNSAMDFVTRRIGAFSMKGLNYDLVQKANAEAWDTFRKTGLNTASMESMGDTGKLGEGKRFDVSSGMESKNPVVRGIESTVRNVAKVTNKVAIDWEHNTTFTKFYQKAFFDMTNITSSNLAKSEGLVGNAAKTRAAEIMTDATKIVPETKEGAMVRMEAQKQAGRVTQINNTWASRLSIGIKDGLNKAIPGLGTALEPIAKISSNIVANGIENAGLGIFSGAKDVFQGKIKIQSTDLATQYEGMAQMANGIQTMGRTMGVLGVAAFFASTLTKQDFKKDIYGDSFVKIGNTWINTEYISAISPALGGMMEVKQNEKPNQGILATGGQYIAGSLQSAKKIPGLDEATTLINNVTSLNYAKGIGKYASNFFTSRGVPAFIPNLLNDRPINRLFFGASGVPDKKELAKLKVK